MRDGVLNSSETDTSVYGRGGVFMQSVAMLTHLCTVHMLTPHHPGLNALTPFMAATSIQKLQSQLAPAQFSQEDQASCYMGSVML